MSLTPEQIAEIAAKAAMSAVQAAMGGAQAPSGVPVKTEDVSAEDQAEIRRAEQEQKANAARAEELIQELIPLIMQPRHMEVFAWMTGGDWLPAVVRILRAEIQRMTPDYREAKGGGGNSSRNLEALSERLTPR